MFFKYPPLQLIPLSLQKNCWIRWTLDLPYLSDRILQFESTLIRASILIICTKCVLKFRSDASVSLWFFILGSAMGISKHCYLIIFIFHFFVFCVGNYPTPQSLITSYFNVAYEICITCSQMSRVNIFC